MHLDVGTRVTDERLHVAAGDDHRVDPGALELDHVRAARARELRDRELAGRDVGQQLEQPVEVRPAPPRPPRRRAARSRGRRARAPLRARPRRARGPRTRGRAPCAASITSPSASPCSAASTTSASTSPTSWLGAEGEQRQAASARARRRRAPHDEALGALLLRGAGAVAVDDLDEHGDAVALCDRLAQPSVRPSRTVMLLGAAVVAVTGADGVGCAPWPGRQAGVPARGGVDREDDARRGARGAVRHGLEPRVRAAVHARSDATADAPWTSWEFTHIARIQCWYEDFLAALGARGPVLRHGRVHDGAVPRGLPRRARRTGSTTSSSGATTCSSSAGSTCRGATTGSGSSRSSGAGCTSATSSGRQRAASPWVLVEGPPATSGSQAGSSAAGATQLRGRARDATVGHAACRTECAEAASRRWQRTPCDQRADRVPDRLQLQEGARSPTGSARCCARTTRLTFSAASTSSAADVVVGAGDVDRVHVHVRREHRRELGAVAGEQVDDAAGQVGGRDRLGELERGQRRASPRRRRRRCCRRRSPARCARRAPRAPARSGATTATTPVGSGTVKLKYGPATGFEPPSTCGSLSAQPAYQTTRSIARSTSRRPRAGRGEVGRRASPSSRRGGRAPGRGCTAVAPRPLREGPARRLDRVARVLARGPRDVLALGLVACGPTRSAGTRRRCRACTSCGRRAVLIGRTSGTARARGSPPSRPKPDSL